MREFHEELAATQADLSPGLSQAATPASARGLTRLAWLLGMTLLAAYCAVFVVLSPLPIQDLPGHLARAVAMSDLLFHGGTRFGDVFQFHWLAAPYLLGDLMLTAAVGLFGPTGASAFWSVFVFLSLPCAAVFYLWARGIGPNRRALALLVSLYLATDWFFLMGFLSFRVAVAMLVATLGLVEMLRRRWSHVLFAVYIGAVVLAYLMHFAASVFLCAALVVTAALRLRWRTTTARTETLLLIPLGVVLAWHFAVGHGYREPGDLVIGSYFWGTWAGKWARLGSEFFRFAPRTDGLLLLALAACVLLMTGAPRPRDMRNPLVLEFLALAATFLVMYFVLPIGYSEAWYVDTRPLPLAALFLLFACLALPRSHSSRRTRRASAAVALATLLAVGNLAYLARHFINDRAWLAGYRSVVAAIPLHGRALPVFTHGQEGAVVPFLHVDGFVTVDRAAVGPYVFAGDNGNPMKYFRYRHRPYDPPQTWYGDVPQGRVDWRAVARDYDFVILTKPFDPRIVGLRTRTVIQNSSAALLAIAR
ncbi:MAG: hypothetical protein JWN85_4440 [Gammaproteobacteria bacterium]|nr:hypothetical protein [Gammaproteobacteria bacterium]